MIENPEKCIGYWIDYYCLSLFIWLLLLLLLLLLCQCRHDLPIRTYNNLLIVSKASDFPTLHDFFFKNIHAEFVNKDSWFYSGFFGGFCEIWRDSIVNIF